jgi:hypothetical protein
MVRARSQGARGDLIETRSAQLITHGTQVSFCDWRRLQVYDAGCLTRPNQRGFGKRNFAARDSPSRSGARGRTNPPSGRRRPCSATLTLYKVARFRSLGNHRRLPGLPGGAEGNRTPDLCSAIAALSHLSYSPLARLFTCASDACQRHRRGGSGRLHFNGSLLKGWENLCVRSSTS